MQNEPAPITQGEPLALMDQLNGEVPDTAPTKEPEKPEIAQPEKDGAIAPTPEGENKPAETPAEPVSEEAKEEAPAETPAETEEKPAEPQAKPVYKIGNVEYATADDALKEATRIIGRNANLAGDIRNAHGELESAKATIAEREAKLQEAIAANKEWQKWAEANAAGENKPMPNIPDADAIAEKVLQKQQEASRQESTKAALTAEFNEVTALPNWDDVEPTIRQIADKLNPLTGKHFTPKEAYRYACHETGAENLLIKKPEAKPAPVPVKPKTNPIASAAARPTASRGNPSGTAKPQRDDIDDFINERFH
jgi:hypothetical protein